MGNPLCPKCNKPMKIGYRLIESRTNPVTKQKIYGRVKFWICKSDNLKFKVGGQVIMK